MKKNALQQFIEDHTHFDMPRGAKMSLALPELKVLLIQFQTLPLGIHHKWKEIMDI